MSRRGTSEIMFCYQTGGPTTGWAHKREGLYLGFCGIHCHLIYPFKSGLELLPTYEAFVAQLVKHHTGNTKVTT